VVRVAERLRKILFRLSGLSPGPIHHSIYTAIVEHTMSYKILALSMLVCPYCNRKFKNKNALKVHLQRSVECSRMLEADIVMVAEWYARVRMDKRVNVYKRRVRVAGKKAVEFESVDDFVLELLKHFPLEKKVE